MSDEILRYTDLAAAIQLATAEGMSKQEIVRALSGGMTHQDALRLARLAAPILEIGVNEFLRLRKNN